MDRMSQKITITTLLENSPGPDIFSNAMPSCTGAWGKRKKSGMQILSLFKMLIFYLLWILYVNFYYLKHCIEKLFIYLYFYFWIVFFKKIFYLYLERGEGREKERERNIDMCERHIDWMPLTHPQLGNWPAVQACALTRNQTGNLPVCRPVLNPLSHTSKGMH